jgi:hypothetical protein
MYIIITEKTGKFIVLMFTRVRSSFWERWPEKCEALRNEEGREVEGRMFELEEVGEKLRVCTEYLGVQKPGETF